MLKFMLCIGICAVVYFVAVGFLRTAEKAGWSESGQVQTTRR